MRIPRQHLLAAITAFTVLSLSAAGVARAQALLTSRTLVPRPLRTSQEQRHTLLSGIAARLGKRVHERYGAEVPFASLRLAVEQRQRLFANTVAARLPVEGDVSGSGASLWTVSLQEHPLWVVPTVTAKNVAFSVSVEEVANSLAEALPLGLPRVRDASVLTEETDAYGVRRVTLTGTAQHGYEFADVDAAQRLVNAMERGQHSVELPLRRRSGTVRLHGSGGTVALELLSVGHSDYKTSPWGRRANIKKGTEEHIDGVLIPRGSEFSFNDTLGGPVTLSRGWFDSLIIVNGSTLEPAPGGGICQVATTVYRAALLAGLGVTQRAPHSLYVHYYKLYGLGLDATIYPGRQDLRFVNDTPSDIVVQARTEGSEVFVEFYGAHDGRSVTLDGPYFAQNEDAPLPRRLRGNEIGWLQRVTRSDGSVVETPIISAYAKMPRSLAAEVADARDDQAALLHAAAPVRVSMQE